MKSKTAKAIQNKEIEKQTKQKQKEQLDEKQKQLSSAEKKAKELFVKYYSNLSHLKNNDKDLNLTIKMVCILVCNEWIDFATLSTAQENKTLITYWKEVKEIIIKNY